MSEPNPEDFDSTDPEERSVATAAAVDREQFVSLMQEYYRGEMSQSGNLLSRLDLTSDWAIVLVTAVLALPFQGGDVTAYLLLSESSESGCSCSSTSVGTERTTRVGRGFGSSRRTCSRTPSNPAVQRWKPGGRNSARTSGGRR